MTKIKKWQVLKTTDVSPSKWFPIRKDKVKLTNGNVIDDFYTARLGDIVMVLPITRNKEIVFVRQYKHGVGEVLIELPAGFIPTGMTAEAAAVLELEEETGIKVRQSDLINMGKTSLFTTKTDSRVFEFAVKDVEFNSHQHLDPTENIEIMIIAIIACITTSRAIIAH